MSTQQGSFNTYIGARYVPIFDGQWDNTKAYEPLVIVEYQGNSYTSKTYVPIGTDINNDLYWAVTGNYNAQIEEYRKQVEQISETLNTIDNKKVNVIDKPFSMTLFSDIHFNNLDYAGISKSKKQNDILSFINSFESDVNISLGDQTNDNYPYGTNTTQKRMSATYLWRFLSPTYFIEGNHDCYNEVLWKKYYYNKKQYILETELFNLVCLNVYGTNQATDDTGALFSGIDYTFLENALKNSDKKVIILLHDFDKTKIQQNIKDLIKQYSNIILCIIGGHYHHWLYENLGEEYGNIMFYRLPSIGGRFFEYQYNGSIPSDWQSIVSNYEKWSCARIGIDSNGLYLSLVSMAETYTINEEALEIQQQEWFKTYLDSTVKLNAYADYKVIDGQKNNYFYANGADVYDNHPKLTLTANILNGDDLNNFIEAGSYKCNSTSIAQSLLNAPDSINSGFRLDVAYVTSDNEDGSYCVQTIINQSLAPFMYKRERSNNTWSNWVTCLSSSSLSQKTKAINSNSVVLDVKNTYDWYINVSGTAVLIPLKFRKTDDIYVQGMANVVTENGLIVYYATGKYNEDTKTITFENLRQYSSETNSVTTFNTGYIFYSSLEATYTPYV